MRDSDQRRCAHARRWMVGTMLMGVSTGAGAQTPERRALSGTDVAVYNLVGVMRVEGSTSSGSDVTVEVTRRGADAAKLQIETGPVRGRETLRVIYPDDRILYRDARWGWGSRTTLHVNEDGTFGDSYDRGRDRRRVEIVSRGSGLDANADVRVLVPRGKKLSVYLGAGEATVSNVDGELLVDVSAASITTTGTKGSLTLDTGSGSVKVSDADGEVDLDTGSGDLELSRVRGPALRLDTGSGGVTASDVTVTSLELDTGSGRVRLSSVRADDVVLDSGSGSIELGLLSDVSSLRVDSGSGSVTISIPENLGAEFSIETGSGGIDFDFPVQVRRQSRGHMAGSIGDGKGRITIDTGSGGIRFRKS